MKNVKIAIGLIFLMTMMTSYLSCVNDDVESTATVDCSGVAVTFNEVSSIISTSCATSSGCHGSGSTRGPGALLSYTQIFSARNSIRTSVANGSMPQGSSLSSDDKNAILCWIDNGAQSN